MELIEIVDDSCQIEITGQYGDEAHASSAAALLWLVVDRPSRCTRTLGGSYLSLSMPEIEMQETNARDATEIRDQIERWAQAITAGDRPAILAHHARELLMFDFPAPLVEGIEAYDRTWDFFYSNPQGPISFVPHDLRVTAGKDVAFASCLVRCDGTSAGHVDLRLTIGLRKIAGEWIVVHEHHSVPTTEKRFLG